MNYINKSLLTLFLFQLTVGIFAQENEQRIKNIIQSKGKELSFTSEDLAHYEIIDQYTDEKTGITYAYVQQFYKTIPIENAIANFALKNQLPVVSNLDRWVSHLTEKIKISNPGVSATDAAVSAIAKSNGTHYLRSKPQVKNELNQNHFIFKKQTETLDDIPAQLVYVLNNSQSELNLYWKVSVHETNGNYWDNYVNAQNGNIELRKNQTLACFSGHLHSSGKTVPALPFAQLVSQYRVWPIPQSAPNDGPSSLLIDPSDKTASQLGWHDDGAAQYTITRGNNVRAFADPDSNYQSGGDEPIGGANLIFDYPYNPSGTLLQNKNAGVVNLFYMNNIMHDFAYYYGFDEKAGNYQTKNFTGTGRGNDHVIALAQFGSNNSRIRNNADFLPNADGNSGRMRMFVWNVSGEKLLKIIEPVSLATDLETGTAHFSPTITTTPLKGKIAIVSDGTVTPQLGCKTLINANDIKGKIALVDRGDCFFHEKACFAAAGAIAVIIVNFENTPNNMAGLSAAPCTVSIPVISISSVDGALLKKNAANIELSIQKPTSNSSLERDGSFDNGVIAHEYGHGISTRLTGGPSSSGCLNNDEQMGEGWSDFMSLVTTIKPTQTANTLVGIGTYPIQQTTSERGIRKYPYTLNMGINDQTYEDIFSTETPHALGEVWTLMLWELYWKMSAVHGWDPDLYKGKGGNNKAIRLVFEGMKLQPCSPGFTDGRDAILKADQLLFNSENQCLIWESFARRGLGFSAMQGSSNNRKDGLQSFDLPPGCIPTVKITKTVTPFIKAGEDITVNITVRNDTKTAAKTVSLTDLIPDGCVFKTNSSNLPLSLSGNKLTHTLAGDLLPGESLTVSYKLESSKSKHSLTYFIDSMESTEFDYDVISNEGSGIWELTDILARSGKKSWFVPDLASDNDQVLNTLKKFDLSTLKQPVIRFYHRYNTEHAFDGGLIRLTTNSGNSFEDLGVKIFRNGYNGPLSYFSIPIPDLRAFYGDSKGFIPTYIDLKDYKNQKFSLQFRWGSDTETSGTGWFIDDLEILDMFNYNSEACINFDGSKSACVEAPEKGTIVESQLGTRSKDLPTTPLLFSLAPNPASDFIQLSLRLPQAMDLRGIIYTTDGKLLKTISIGKSSDQLRSRIDTHDLPSGMYVLSLKGGNYAGQQKFVIHR